MDKLAERRKRAQRQEAMAKLTQKVNMEMARDLDNVKAQSFAEGFEAGITEARRMAWASGTIGNLRDRLDRLRASMVERRRAS